MGILGRVLQGIGSALVEQGKIDAQAARDDLLMRRELALKQLEFQHDDAVRAQTHTDKLEEIGAQGAETRRTDLFQGVIAERRDQAKAKRDLTHDITIKKIDFSNSASLEGLRHRYKLTEDQYSSMLQAGRDAAADGRTIDRVVFSTDGQMQLVYKNGNVMSKGPKGAYNPTGSDDSGDDGIPGIAPRSTAAAAAPQPTPKVAKPQGDVNAAVAQLGNIYAKASQDPATYRSKYPQLFGQDGKLIPRDQAIQRVRQAYNGG